MQESEPRDSYLKVASIIIYRFLTLCASESSHVWSIVALWINGGAVVAASQAIVACRAVVGP